MKSFIEQGTFWLPRQSSTIAVQVDEAWDIVTIASIVLFVIVVGAMIAFVVRYHRKSETQKVSQLEHHFGLEVFWTALPTILVMWLFFIGYKGFLNATVAPADAMEIRVVGQKWSWAFTYPNGATTMNELRVPKGKPVKLILSAKDVLHSFFIPEFRVKRDAVPGAYNILWFEATRTGQTMVECAQYCGKSHSDMLAHVIMMDPADYQKWLDEGDNAGKGLTPAEYGKLLYTKLTCNTCHSVDGSPVTGPTFKGVFGRHENLEGGASVTVDENYIRESILSPQAKVVKGFQPVMPTFQGLVKDREIDALIAFLKTQK